MSEEEKREIFVEFEDMRELCIFTFLCKELKLEYQFGTYIADSTVVVVRLEGNAKDVETLEKWQSEMVSLTIHQLPLKNEISEVMKRYLWYMMQKFCFLKELNEKGR